MSLQDKIRNEANFEAKHVSSLREKYLELNIPQRLHEDEAYRRKTQVIANFLGEPTKKVLDVGCNTGGEAAFMQSLGHQVVAGDVNEVALEIARERCSGMSPAPTFMFLDAHNLPFEDGEFDAVVCWEVLHHLAGLDLALAELYRVMRPGAIALAYEPYKYNPYRRFSEVVHRIRTRGHGIEKSFGERQITKILTQARFQSIYITRESHGLTEWKANRYSPLKTWGGRLYYALQERFPKVLAPMIITFQKPLSQ